MSKKEKNFIIEWSDKWELKPKIVKKKFKEYKNKYKKMGLNKESVNLEAKRELYMNLGNI